ncbi:MAG: 50S ribosomal protein L11 methyltransferase [Melioribacteraceae bacterium]|nr:50S ribosomal protein L11 methyltransferase [Melioribacteraceae bacterium]
MKNYKTYSITFFPFNVDVVSGRLWELDITGINEEESFLKIYTGENSAIITEDFEKVLDSLVNENLIERYEITEGFEEQRNWNEYWESKRNIIKVSKTLVIRPSFREYHPREGEVVITLDPKMSFGTGEHETTRLCLQLIEEIKPVNSKVLDVGSGTSLLAIYAAKLGAADVIAVDNDEWCLENGLENIKANKVENIVKPLLGEIDSINEYDFDVIIANINKNVLNEIAEAVSKRIKKTGKLILSGFYKSDTEEITRIYEYFSFSKNKELFLSDWASIILQKN